MAMSKQNRARTGQQVPLVPMSIHALLASKWFADGVADQRGGRGFPQDYDEWAYIDHRDPGSDWMWSYERGRLWASMVPRSVMLKRDGNGARPGRGGVREGVEKEQIMSNEQSKFSKAAVRQFYGKCLRVVAKEMDANGEIVDLPEAKRQVELGALYAARDLVFDAFDKGFISGPQGDQMLAVIEKKIEELEGQCLLHSFGLLPPPRGRHAWQLAEHRARRGVRKIRGAK
jgi:hypothetical protein